MSKAELVAHLLAEHGPVNPFSDTDSLGAWTVCDLRSLHLGNHEVMRVRNAPPPDKTRDDLEPGQYAYEIELKVYDPEWPGSYKFTFVSERRLLGMGAIGAFTPLMMSEVFGTLNPSGLPSWGFESVEEYGSSRQ